VGGTLVERVLVAGGHGPLHQVAAQRDPDPDFPTVAFPNPEEPGALDRLLELAERVGALAALANDPDADRLAVALPHATRSWEVLTGDQLGALLCHHLLDLSQGTPDRLVTSTVVSSRLVARICEHAGVHHAETLTGFKWLCRPAMANPAWTQVLAYEEALGYAVGPAARDKDGITAALVAADLVARLHAAGRTPWDVLDDLGRAHGEHVTANGSHRLDGPGAAERVAALVDRLASRPPTGFGGRPVVGADRPAPDVFRWWLDDDTRVVLRPSGTEPKVKHYCEAVEAVGPTPDSPGAARRRAAARLAGAVADVAALVDRAGD
jgi:phosphomannomutase